MPHVLEGLRQDKSVEFTWQVTQEDIDNGERDDCRTCPIAVSLNRVLPGLTAEVFHDEIILFEGNDEEFKGDMPEIGNRFIWDFDSDEPVGPFTMTVKFTRL